MENIEYIEPVGLNATKRTTEARSRVHTASSVLFDGYKYQGTWPYIPVSLRREGGRRGAQLELHTTGDEGSEKACAQ